MMNSYSPHPFASSNSTADLLGSYKQTDLSQSRQVLSGGVCS